METQHKAASPETQSDAHSQFEDDDDIVPPPVSPSGLPRWLIISIGIFVAMVLFVSIKNLFHVREVEKTTKNAELLPVILTQPQMGSPDIDLILPGNVLPNAETPIFARTDGYVKRWLVDIGTPVKQGQLLAEIDSPEVDQQYDQAEAAVAQAAANLKLSQDTAQRWKYLLQKSSVSQQETEEKQKEMEASVANLNQAKANLGRLEKMKSFERVVAPFDGVVTMRKVNVGDLINSGSGVAKSEMFHITQDNLLRVYVNVPETYASQVKVGQKANVKLASMPGQVIEGKIVNTAGAIDQQSRTLLVEVQVDNSARKYLAGGYATVDFPLHLAKPILILPVNALLFRPEGTQVGVVGNDHTVKLKKIEIGKDFGTTVEVVKGLEATEQVIVNPADSIREGDKVRIEPVRKMTDSR